MEETTIANHIEFTLSHIINYLTDRFSDELEVFKAETKRCTIDALSYNVVVEATREQIEVLKDIQV